MTERFVWTVEVEGGERDGLRVAAESYTPGGAVEHALSTGALPVERGEVVTVVVWGDHAPRQRHRMRASWIPRAEVAR